MKKLMLQKLNVYIIKIILLTYLTRKILENDKCILQGKILMTLGQDR